MNQEESKVTICVTPRERFSGAIDSLKSIIANTSIDYQLVYVDANSPAGIGQDIKAICLEHGFTYVRKDAYLPPNQARNIGLSMINTRYVAFVDNDLFVDPGWLHAMIECAQDTDAWAVAPVILEGTQHIRVVHMAGGDLTERPQGEHNTVICGHRYLKQPLGLVRKDMVREPTGYFEFHCVLLRADKFAEREFLDEQLLCNNEHVDLSLEIRKAGGTVYFEPDSVVRYDTATPFQQCDRAFFELRWSPQWSEQTIAHVRSKWGLADDDASMNNLMNWTARHRKLFEQSQRSWLAQNLPIVIRRTVGAQLRKYRLLPAKNAN